MVAGAVINYGRERLETEVHARDLSIIIFIEGQLYNTCICQ